MFRANIVVKRATNETFSSFTIYFAVVAVPRETKRSSQFPAAEITATVSVDRSKRHRAPIARSAIVNHYARVISPVVELLIRIDRWFNSPRQIQFLFPAFRCSSHGLFFLRRSQPRGGEYSRRRDSKVPERTARSPCAYFPQLFRRSSSTQRCVLRAMPRHSSQITFRRHSVRRRTRVHRLAAVYLRVRRSRTLQPSSRGHRAVDQASSVKVASRVARSVASRMRTLARRPGVRCNPTIETGARNKCWIATASNAIVWVPHGGRWTNLDYENFVQEAELIRTSRTRLPSRGGISKGTPRDRESNQNARSYWLANCW